MGTIFDREHEPPEDSDADQVIALVKTLTTIASALAGGPAGAAIAGGSALLGSIFKTPFAQRRAEWEQEITEVVRRLERERGIRPEELRDHPAFIDAALTAYQSFVRTSETRKREALRNAVANAALGWPSQTRRQDMFMSLLDRFTATHLALLALFHAPKSWRDSAGHGLRVGQGDASLLVYAAFDDGQRNWVVYRQAWSDLYAAGLVRTPDIENGMEGPLLELKPRTTDVGAEFLRFIASPLPE